MAGLKEDDPPLTDSQKLDRILAQITTINKRLDTHDLRLSRLEKQKVEDNAEQSPEDPKTEDSAAAGAEAEAAAAATGVAAAAAAPSIATTVTTTTGGAPIGRS